ncbi:membrane coat complex retromer [Sarcoptes scabiei]|nr:membrane coat complex retromer [Sarcoptes scabiei]
MSLFFHFIHFRMDLCVPSTCTRDDMQKVSQMMADLVLFRAKVLRCEFDQTDRLPEPSTAPFLDSVWSKWNVSTIVWLIILMKIALTLTGTLIDFSMLGNLNRSNPNQHWLRSFSISDSWRKLTDSNNESPIHLRPLFGLQTIIFIWIIIVHTLVQVEFQFFRELKTFRLWATKWPSQIITNSLFQFDSLILINAFIFGYKITPKNRKQWIECLIRKYLKMVTLMIIIIITSLSIPYLILPGPLREDFIPNLTKNFDCQTRIWNNFLFIQNLTDPLCLPFSWIFCVELQLSMLMIGVILIISIIKIDSNRSQKLFCNWIFWLPSPILVCIGFIVNFIQVFNQQLPPTYYWTLPDKSQRHQYFVDYYWRPSSHLTVFVLGFYAGIYRKLTAESNNNILVNAFQNFVFRNSFLNIGPILALGTFLCFTFGFNEWIINELPTPLISAFYNSSHLLLLSLALIVILFWLSNETSSINWILSSKFMTTFGHLTWTGFILLPNLQLILLGNQQQNLYSGPILMIYTVIGNIVLTYLLAFALKVLIEIPTRSILEKIVLYPLTSSVAKATMDEKSSSINEKNFISNGKLSQIDLNNTTMELALN